MPLLLNKRIDDKSAYAVWNLTETYDQLKNIFNEEPPFSQRSNRQYEWMVGRILVKELCEWFNIDFEGIDSNEFGKPFLKNHLAHISITHSFPYVATLICLDAPCGIDIEFPRTQLEKVKKKYIKEDTFYTLAELTIIWTIKEAVFKAMGRSKGLTLRDDVEVTLSKSPRYTAQVTRKEEGIVTSIDVQVEWLKNYVLAYCFLPEIL